MDTSVLVRIVLRQPDKLTEWGTFEPLSSALVEVETMRAIEWHVLERKITVTQGQQARELAVQLLAATDLVDVDRAVLRRASSPWGTHLRALDAVHLATALLWRESEDAGDAPLLATHDERHFAPAARAFGFEVIGV